MMVAPKTDLKEKDILPKDICFVIDTSGSMSGEKMEQAKKALEYCVHSLGKKDRFNIVRFSTDVETFRDELTPVKKQAIDEAGEFISNLVARGGTDINWSLEKALSMKSGDKRPFLVVFLTDGKPTIGTTDPKAILANVASKNQKGVRVFVFGVGNEVNTHLLDQISGGTKATSQYVKPDEDIEVKVSSFYDKVSSPVLANLKLKLGDIGAYDYYPREMPDLFKGTQLLVLGRYKKDGHVAVQLTGDLDGKKQSFVYEESFPAEEKSGEYIANLWANRKVGYLLDEIRLKGENKELVDEVVALGKEFAIVTPYTSYLIVEDDKPRTARATPPPPAARRPGGPVLFGGAERGRTEAERTDAGRRLAKNLPTGEADEEGAMAADASGVAEGGEAKAAGKKADRQREAKLKYGYAWNKHMEKAALRLSAKDGAGAVAASEALDQLKSREVAESKAEQKLLTGSAKAYGTKFEIRNGTWTDTAWKQDNEVVKIKYLSDAYFKLLERDPELKEALALGEQVLVVLKSGKAILVGEDGKDNLSNAELDGLFGGK